MQRNKLPNFLVLPLLAFMACKNIQTYPTNWPNLIPFNSDGGSSIEGVYSAVAFGDSKAELVQILSGYNHAPNQSADHFLVVESGQGTLDIIAYSVTVLVAKFHYSIQDKTMKYTSTGIVALVSDGFIGGQGVVGHAKITASFSRDTDGYLVLRRNESAIGAYGIIPIVGKSEGWYRFQPIKPNTP